MPIRFPLSILLSVALLGCGDDGGNDGIECVLDSHCDRQSGGDCIVAPSGKQWCAYPDATCESGLRYDERDVGDGLAGMCVASEAPDAGIDGSVDGSVDASLPDASISDAGTSCNTSDECSAGNYCHFNSCTPCADLSVVGFNQPENLTALNTASNDYNISLSGDGTKLYILHSGTGFKEYPIDSAGNIGAGTTLAIPNVPGSIVRLRIATADLTTFYISERVDIGGTTAKEISIWRSTWSGSSFSTPVEVPELNQADSGSGFMSISADGTTIYFSSDRPVSGDPIVDDNIWTATANGATWSTPTRITGVSTNNEESAPTVTGDVLIYTSSSSGFNQTLQLSSPIGSSPVPISDANLAGTDTSFGVLTPDLCTLYFASNRSGGAGGFDVWRTTRR